MTQTPPLTEDSPEAPPTIEIPHGEALTALMAKDFLTAPPADVDAVIRWVREERRARATAALAKEAKARERIAKAEAASAKKLAKLEAKVVKNSTALAENSDGEGVQSKLTETEQKPE